MAATSSPGAGPESQERFEPMNMDQLQGGARNIGGRVQEAAGSLTGDAKTRAEGIANQAAGSVQEAFGEATEAVADAYDYTEDAVRDFIETRPYTTAAIALGVGWLIGKMASSR
jgi:uncharacterized protein YjbJ (UPF0337 family)